MTQKVRVTAFTPKTSKFVVRRNTRSRTALFKSNVISKDKKLKALANLKKIGEQLPSDFRFERQLDA